MMSRMLGEESFFQQKNKGKPTFYESQVDLENRKGERDPYHK